MPLKALFFVILTLPLGAEPTILATGPTFVDHIPLNQVQMVSSWKGIYRTTWGPLVVYGTTSRFFNPTGTGLDWKGGRYFKEEGRVTGGQTSDAVLKAVDAPGGWAWVFFVPRGTDLEKLHPWILQFLKEFDRLENLPTKGQAVAFPSVLAEVN